MTILNKLTLTEQAGHRFLTGTLPAVADLCDAALADVLAIPDAAFDTLSNPFESKLLLRSKHGLPEGLGVLMAWLEGLAVEAAAVFGVPSLVVDTSRHYAGVFRYAPGGHLSAHVDAGIHPATGQRKHVTALVYLGSGSGDLELWEGSNCAGEAPTVNALAAGLPPRHGSLVLFENNDHAWHAAAVNTGLLSDRIVVTVSYMSAEVERFRNRRQRAYFAPRPGETWTPAMVALRDQRADPDAYAQAYRIEGVQP